MQAWNDNTGLINGINTPVQPGDRIRSVNNFRGNVNEMIAECGRQAILRMIVARSRVGAESTGQSVSVRDQAVTHTDVHDRTPQQDATGGTASNAADTPELPMPPLGEEFEITLDKIEGTRLGIDVDRMDGRTLLVTTISSGLVQAWNEANSDRRVEPGDRIVAVNECRGDVDQLLGQCQGSNTLKMMIARPQGADLPRAQAAAPAEQRSAQDGTALRPEEDAGARQQDTFLPDPEAALPSVEFDISLDKTEGTKLGIDVDRQDGKTMLITSINDGLVQGWNEANSDQQVRPGDRVVAVNDFRGDVEQLLMQCQSSDTLRMKLKRG